jgi:hypothetical protein
VSFLKVITVKIRYTAKSLSESPDGQVPPELVSVPGVEYPW